ncbi:uncharacterized protein G2W53_028604 [Senna tora]|uniref:Uncharacterized protein n=1 Tax=Senna tora TaxID=362788 RepID=A0A834T4J3_9FABA|nr:uncharacterized protein G2W53_028604 [Senna tora]
MAMFGWGLGWKGKEEKGENRLKVCLEDLLGMEGIEGEGLSNPP